MAWRSLDAPRQFDLCTGDDRKWAYAVGDAVALVFDLRDERVPATLAFAPRRAFGADGIFHAARSVETLSFLKTHIPLASQLGWDWGSRQIGFRVLGVGLAFGRILRVSRRVRPRRRYFAIRPVVTKYL